VTVRRCSSSITSVVDFAVIDAQVKATSIRVGASAFSRS